MRKIITVSFMVFALAAGTTLTAAPAAASSAPSGKKVEVAQAEAYAVLTNEEAMVVAEDNTPESLRGFSGKLLMYVPNRIMDLLDIFSFELKTGAAVGVEVRLTRAFGIAAGAGATGDFTKGYNRQFGFASTQGYEAQFLIPMIENTDRSIGYGYINKFWVFGNNFPLPSDAVYLPVSGARDYWALEAGATCLVGAKAAFHPVAFVDFLAGLIFLDPRDNDYRLDPITN